MGGSASNQPRVAMAFTAAVGARWKSIDATACSASRVSARCGREGCSTIRDCTRSAARRDGVKPVPVRINPPAKLHLGLVDLQTPALAHISYAYQVMERV